MSKSREELKQEIKRQKIKIKNMKQDAKWNDEDHERCQTELKMWKMMNDHTKDFHAQ